MMGVVVEVGVFGEVGVVWVEVVWVGEDLFVGVGGGID